MHKKSKQEPTPEVEKKKLPVLYRSDFVHNLMNEGQNTVMPGDSWVICLSGIRGAGKSLSLAELIARALVNGLTVWSNMAVAFKCVDGPKRTRILKTTPLDIEAIYMLEEGIKDGVVAIDEAQYLMDSRMSNATGHRLINAVVNQIRKRKLDFYFTVKELQWVDVRLRWECDIEVACRDLSKGNHEIKKGHYIQQMVYDKSGAWTGRPWKEYEPPTVDRILNEAWRFWPIYNTTDIIDFLDAMRGVRLDMEKRVITDKEQVAYDYDTLISSARDILSNGKIASSEFWDRLGVSNNRHKGTILNRLKDSIGVQEKYSSGKRYLNLM